MITRFLSVFFLAFFVSTFFIVPSVSAVIDQRCFTKPQCLKEVNPKGFVNNTTETIEVCGAKNAHNEPLGFCLPAGEVSTQITINRKGTFVHLGEYVETVYQFSIATISVVAIIMILIAGLQWMASAGSPERISSAKKRIISALIGLLLAVFSFVILQTINPYLVRLRLPQIWAINQQGISTAFCSDLPSGTFVDRNESGSYTLKKNDGVCNKEYFVKDTGGLQCSGTKCPSGNTCTRQQNNTFACEEGNITGTIYASSPQAISLAQSTADVGTVTTFERYALRNLIADTVYDLFVGGWEWEWADEPTIYYVCEDGTHDDLSTNESKDPKDDANLDPSTATQFYGITVDGNTEIDGAAKRCADVASTLKGFLLYLDMNQHFSVDDEGHFIGVDKSRGINVTDTNSNTDTIGDLKSANKNIFITAESLKRGIRINVNSEAIPNNDNDLTTELLSDVFDIFPYLTETGICAGSFGALCTGLKFIVD
jgi:hypothetical protein